MKALRSFEIFVSAHPKTVQTHDSENPKSRTELIFLCPIGLHPAVSLCNWRGKPHRDN